MLTDSFSHWDATTQADLVRRGEIAPIELVELAIAQIEKQNPELNAVITPLFDQARTQALNPNLPDGPFRGVPLLLKDYFCEIDDTPYYEGMGFLRGLAWRSQSDSFLGAKFRAAGFVFLGKTNLPELALTAVTASRAFGATRNPFDVTRTAGGSSGGSAAAVASGMVAVAHGNDGTGSIRVPASCCGLVGLKPSRGRISYGAGKNGGLLGNVSEFVLTRSVRDAAGILDAVAGNLPGDLFVAPTPVRPYRDEIQREPKSLRIGLMLHDAALKGLKDLDPTIPDVHLDCVAAVQQTGHLLESLGHTVEYAYPIELEGPTGLGPALGILSASGLAAKLDAWSERTERTITRDDVEPATWERAEQGRKFSAVQIHAAYQRLIAGVCRVPDWWTRGFDLLVTPTMGQPAPTFDTIRTAAPNALMGAFGLFTMPYNFTGQPALSLPLSWTADGLPVGVQFVAAYGCEDLLLHVAAQLETARPWSARYPA